jgi:hypothetical protein
MLVPTLRAAWIAVLLAPAACNQPPWIISRTPDAITLRWYSDEIDSAVADGVAQEHCEGLGRRAELISYNQDGSADAV